MGLIEDILLSSWFGAAVGAIVLTFLSAYLTLRANIREKAWLVVYKEKRREIRALISSMDEFASTINRGCEVIALDQQPISDQIGNLCSMVRQRFGPETVSSDPLHKGILDVLP